MTTEGGLVFTGDAGGMSAREVGTKTLGPPDFGQNSSGNAMTYMVGGKQYIAMSGATAMVAYALE